MTVTCNQRKPTFLWQAILILLPMVVLAAVGAISLRQDRILAERETATRAQAIADELAGRIWLELTSRPDPKLWNPRFQIDLSGKLVFPPPYEPVPSPLPLNFDELNPLQKELWIAMQAGTANGDATINTVKELLGSNLPERFVAIARYNLGLLFLQRQDFSEAAGMFLVIATNAAPTLGETGLPLRPLAQLKLLELASVSPNNTGITNIVTSQSLFSEAIRHPTVLTPFLLNAPLEQFGNQGEELRRPYRKVWQYHELSRGLFSQAKSHFGTAGNRAGSFASPGGGALSLSTKDAVLADMSGMVQLPHLLFLCAEPSTSPDSNWFGVRHDESPTNQLFVFRAEAELGQYVSGLISGATQIPGYFGVGVEFGGWKPNVVVSDLRLWRYHHYGGKGGHVEKEYLTDLGGQSSEQATNALAFAAKSEDGIEVLKVSVYLTSPTALFESQRNRALWFVLVIATSMIAAVFGLCAAWGGFNRQLRLNEMKSNFVSSVSHELRAPIASVRLLAESLERGKISEPAKQNEYFRFIGQECRRLSALIENVLDFSRIEQGRKQYEFEPTDIGALVEQTVKLMEPYAAEKGVRLETSNIQHPTSNSEGSRSGIELNVDGRAIQQALVNLIDNAIKHSPKDETVTVRLEGGQRRTGVAPGSNLDFSSASALELTGKKELETAATAVLLSVTDHGPGIPASEQEKIFERFYRLGSELRRETPGVGIGLSIVKHVVEAHGGRMRVASEVGKGSRFTIELPGINAKTQRGQDAEKT